MPSAGACAICPRKRPGPLPTLFQATLCLADRAADNPVGPVCLHYCGKLGRAVLHMEKKKKVQNDLLCDSVGHYR